MREPEPDWQWLEVGTVASFPEIGFSFHLGLNGALTQFKSEDEALAYSYEYAQKHGLDIDVGEEGFSE